MKTTQTTINRSLWLTTLLMSTLLLGCQNDDDPTSLPPVVTTPTVTSVTPMDTSTAVQIGTSVSATFSEAMDTSTINDESFVLSAETQAVAGSVIVDAASNTATFTPTVALSASTTYKVTVTSAATSVAGQALADDFVWSFTTDIVADTTAPTITSNLPLNEAVDVALNSSISVNASEALAVSTINTTSFTVSDGTTVITGTITQEGLMVTFVPAEEMSPATLYTATLTTAITDLAVPANSLASNYVWSFTTAAIIDTTAPTVSSTDPIDSATDIVLDTKISANFSEALDSSSVNTTSFTVKNGTTPVAGVVTSSGSTATFTPNDELAANTLYTATLTTAINDLAISPNALANDYVWSFTSGRTTPTITLTNPLDTETDVAINHSLIATFSESMDASSIDTLSFTLSAPGPVAIAGTISLEAESNTAIFQPNSDFNANTLYSATITTAAMSSTGMPLLSDYNWSFTTVSAPDVTAPTVTATDPLDNAINFALNRNLVVEFSEALEPSSVNSTSFTITDGVTFVAGSLVYAGTSVTFNPTDDLAANTLYTATLTTAITDLATPANPLASDYIWSFTTSAAAAQGPEPVELRTAGDFVILTKTGTTNVHSSAITGNMGASPITAAAMDNVFCTEITGTIYGSNAAYTGSGDVSCFAGAAPDNTLVANAVLDMGTAYNDAAGRTSPDFTELYAGDISGRTLIPGLYKWGTGVLISTDVTLTGGANDVWIFQVSGDITQADASRIILSGGAQAKNIFWQVAGGAGVTIGTTAHFEGVILAEKAIVVNTGATVSGRLLAHTAVTLDQNAVSQPTE
ncbi:Ig-like domain-containing protein [Colwellia sp. M166]|uniref:Ig-like domain-containing protein n=1 Tax=Colwellia sp. M166 TaxID=2583805 RepID=UPI00211F41C5|nr:Ig-like domain-containing protein [Colwellia sp. M166]|tara:strand:- start:40056 stop:42485 length:2430 start_codon:yes stop_codon:yes gene_type:complete